MKAVIIGAGGFLGSSVCRHFSAKGGALRTLSYRPSNHPEFCEEFTGTLLEFMPNVVINAGASQTGKDDPGALADLINSNVLLPATLGSLILQHSPQTQLINFGTSWQIGEQGESSPFNAYAASKAAAEPFLDHFALSGLKAATLRLYDTYGPGDTRNKIVNLIADALNAKSALSMSAGGQMIDLVHVDDVLAAVDITVALQAQSASVEHRVYAVRSGTPVRILDVMAQLTAAAGLTSAEFIKVGVYPYRSRERFTLFADTPTPPGWVPRIKLADGLKATLEQRRQST